MTDSDEDSDNPASEQLPSLAQTEFDNSVLRMGRSLLAAAEGNTPSGMTVPTVSLRLTRLDPSGEDADPRIAQTIHALQAMGIDVHLGEGDDVAPLPPPKPTIFVPSTQVNIDLSTLIALVSDLTHSPLPTSVEEAHARFIPPQKYVEWKKQRLSAGLGSTSNEKEIAVGDEQPDTQKHSRALARQVLQEMSRGMLQEVRDRLAAALPSSARSSTVQLPHQASDIAGVEFWTTPEARDRCLMIISKIGGPNERRRAHALFALSSPSASPPSLQEATDSYWKNSRYPSGFLPLLPIHLYPTSGPRDVSASTVGVEFAPHGPATFFAALEDTCNAILRLETMPHPRALPFERVDEASVPTSHSGGEIQRATVTKANPRLTAHTVQSMRWGAALHWTTLTANKASVRAILREMKAAGAGVADFPAEGEGDQIAALWTVDPRSLAEGMRADAA